MNIEDYKNMDIETLERTKQLITEIIEENKETKSKKKKPDQYETYYYINAANSVITVDWHNDPMDNDRYDYGNVYMHIQDANEEVEYRELQRELKKFAEENNNKIDMMDKSISKYYLRYNVETNIIAIDFCNAHVNPELVYFSSFNIADEIRRQLDDRLVNAYRKKLERGYNL